MMDLNQGTAGSRKISLLLVEDEKNLRQTLGERLCAEGFDVVTTKDVASTLSLVQSNSALVFDLAIVDIGLPDGNGFDLAKQLQAMKKIGSLLFLTAQAGPEDRVKGLELGADDYMAKPFHTKELFLRIRNVLTRKSGRSPTESSVVALGRGLVNFEKYEVILRDNQILTLSQKECALLKLLFENQGRVVSREVILTTVWAEDRGGAGAEVDLNLKELPTTRTVDNFILRLRRLLEENIEEPKLIRSVRGVGYCLQPQNPEIKG